MKCEYCTNNAAMYDADSGYYICEGCLIEMQQRATEEMK